MISEPAVFVSTACLPGTQTLESRISLYRQHGLDAIELGARVVIERDGLSRIATLNGRLLVHNYFPPPAEPFVLNLASGNGDIRSRSLALVCEALALSARLGASFYSVHAGFITDPVGFETEGFIFQMPAASGEANLAMERFTNALGIALERARDLGVQLLVENNVCPTKVRGKLLLQTAEEFMALFREMPPRHLGILLDTGHLNVTACTLKFDRLDFVRRVSPYVRAFHVHDNDGTADTHRPIEPGSWVLDVLRLPQFAGLPIIVEARFETAEQLRLHVDWLRNELGHG